jgi:hypothetical protein
VIFDFLTFWPFDSFPFPFFHVCSFGFFHLFMSSLFDFFSFWFVILWFCYVLISSLFHFFILWFFMLSCFHLFIFAFPYVFLCPFFTFWFLICWFFTFWFFILWFFHFMFLFSYFIFHTSKIHQTWTVCVPSGRCLIEQQGVSIERWIDWTGWAWVICGMLEVRGWSLEFGGWRRWQRSPVRFTCAFHFHFLMFHFSCFFFGVSYFIS